MDKAVNDNKSITKKKVMKFNFEKRKIYKIY